MRRRRTGLVSGAVTDGRKLAFARAMRRAPTESEARAWSELRGCQWRGLAFRRQHVVAGFIVDFFCNERALVVEIDGEVHQEATQQQRDAERTHALERLGLRVVRVAARDVLDGKLTSVLERALRPTVHAGPEEAR